MTITEKNLAEKLKGLFLRTPIDDEPWEQIARRAAELLGVDLAPEPKPLPTEPGSVIIATEVRGETGEWRMFRGPGGHWLSAGPIGACYHHSREHITAWTPARVVPEGEPINLGDVRVGDRVWMELDNGAQITFTVKRVELNIIESDYNYFPINIIRTIYLLRREEA